MPDMERKDIQYYVDESKSNFQRGLKAVAVMAMALIAFVLYIILIAK